MRKIFTTLFTIAAPRVLFACPVCFGESDSPMALAANMGILAMLVVTVGVLVGFASFFIFLVRRARLAANEMTTSAAPYASHGAKAQEGTAQ